MNQERIFTQEELEEMGTRTVDLVERAVDLGENERVKRLSRRMYRETLAMHDFYRDWVTSLLTFIGRRYGDEILYQAFEESLNAWLEAVLDMYEKADIRRRVQLFAGALRGHGQPVEIKEDEEKFIFRMKLCGSGGRQIREGKYDPPQNFLTVRRPQPMTYWKEDFPVYCCHHHFIASLPIAWGRSPAFWEIASDKPGEEPCECWLYKDPEAVPPEAYARTGVER